MNPPEKQIKTYLGTPGRVSPMLRVPIPGAADAQGPLFRPVGRLRGQCGMPVQPPVATRISPRRCGLGMLWLAAAVMPLADPGALALAIVGVGHAVAAADRAH